ncbi:MAG: hypothetical protein GQE15_29730 [Archangiaceae bacterium]|nr:hypothetical protein [Archangiaceae bacterium]
MSLDQAKRALESGKLSEGVVALLEAWRAVPAPRIADVLDGLSKRSPRGPIQGKNQAELTRAFLERVAEKNPLDPPRLAEVIGTTRSQQMVEQLEALLDWPADPRWTTPFLRLLTNPPFTGSGTQSAWRRLFKLLQQTADPRLLERLPALDFAALLVRPGQANVEAFAAEFFTERRDAVLAAVRKKHKAGAPRIGAADEATLAAIERLVATDTVTQLEAQVFAAPQSEAPAVLTDYLLEKGDERGEFMALQQQRLVGRLSEEQEAREEALLEKHATTWLGALATVVEPTTVRFERGFPAACELTTGQPALLASVANDPAWATVRHLHLHSDVPQTLLRSPALKQLEAVTLIREAAARAMLNAPEAWPWRQVALDLPSYQSRSADVALLQRRLTATFPNLTSLALDGYQNADDAFDWVTSLPVMAQLRWFGVNFTHSSRLAATLDRLLKRVPPTVDLDLSFCCHQGYRFRLHRSTERRVLELAGRGYQGTTSVPNDVLLEAAAPLAGTLHEVCFTSRATKAHRAKAEALLASGGVVRVSKEGARVPLPD